MDIPRLNTSFAATSHAHPSPAQPSPWALEERRVRELIARQRIAVNLHGLSCRGAVTVPDIITPKIRRSPFNEEVAASHLDLVECWKGLSHLQATELTMWYRFFHICLQSEVRASLYEDLVKGLMLGGGADDEVYLIPHMLEYLSSRRHRVIDISFVDLIDCMMGMFYDHYPDTSASVSSQWSNFSGGLSLFLQNFLRVQDCFLDTPDGPCLLVDFEYTYTDSVLTATGDVTWHLPDVRFLNLPISRVAGEEYRITPFRLTEFHSPISSPGCGDYVDEVRYTLPRSVLSFRWDSLKQCFKAIVPDFGNGELPTIETMLNATIVTPFPDHVQFERQSRWSIKLDVVPAKIARAPSITCAKRDAENNSDRGSVQRKSPHCKSPTGEVRGRRPITPRVGHDTVLRSIENEHVPASLSSQKRKVSMPSHVEVHVDAKRRRRDSIIASENEPATPPRKDVEKEVADLAIRGRHEPCADSDRPRTVHLGAGKWHSCSSSAMAHTWNQCPDRATLPSPPDSAIASSTTSAPNSAVDAPLEQAQILRNFQEFAERKQRNAAAASPVSDTERRVFESIFLDSDDWSPVTDSSAAGFDTVMGEI